MLAALPLVALHPRVRYEVKHKADAFLNDRPHLRAGLNAARRRPTAYGLDLIGTVEVRNADGLVWEASNVERPALAPLLKINGGQGALIANSKMVDRPSGAYGFYRPMAES